MSLGNLELILGLPDEVLNRSGTVGLAAERLVRDHAKVTGRLKSFGVATQGSVKKTDLSLVQFKNNSIVSNSHSLGHGQAPRSSAAE